MTLAVTATGGGVFSLSRTMVDLSTVLLGDANRLFLTILAIVGDVISVLEFARALAFSLSPLALIVGISLSLAASSSSFSVGVPMNTRSSSPSSRSFTGV